MITHFKIIPPAPCIAAYVQRIFVLESAGKLPSDDLKLIVPNACPKLVFPFKNGIYGKSGQWEHTSGENRITFIGISDIPASVDFLKDEPAGNITVEFTPLGAYRFAQMNWSDVKNRIHHYIDIAPRIGYSLEQQLANTENTDAKIDLVQQFLLNRFHTSSADPLFEYCVQEIIRCRGKLSMPALEKYTGYSARWLNAKFRDHIGISPKNLASIIRFQQYYGALVTDTEAFFLEKEFYNFYYDQSHFIKDFRRFTGHPPLRLSKSSNNYDRFFYKG